MNEADASGVLVSKKKPARQARVIGKLTTLSVRQAKARGLYGDGGGLFLQVSNNGARSWIFRFKTAGKLRVMGLGATHTVSLAEARDWALECRKLRLAGRDPIDERRAARSEATIKSAKAVTFRQAAEKYTNAHKAGWR